LVNFSSILQSQIFLKLTLEDIFISNHKNSLSTY